VQLLRSSLQYNSVDKNFFYKNSAPENIKNSAPDRP
jgi:hypothetical protein